MSGRWVTIMRLLFVPSFFNRELSLYRTLLGWDGMSTPDETAVCEDVLFSSDLGVPLHVVPTLQYGKTSIVQNYADMYGTRTVHLCGVGTESSVFTTAVGLAEWGYRPVVLYDLCASGGGESMDASMRDVIPRVLGSEQMIMSEDLV